MSPEQIGPLIGVGIALLVIMLKGRKPRTLRPQWMWVVPLLITVLIGLGLWGMTYSPAADHSPFGLVEWAMLAVGLMLGGTVGWWRGRMTTIFREADGTLKSRASPLGLILIVGLLAGRSLLRGWLEANAAAWHINPMALADAFMVFVVGLVVMQRVEMFIRARRIQHGQADPHVEPIKPEQTPA